MFRYKWYTTLIALLLPFITFAQDFSYKKTFFPGKSWYFWVFSVLGFYFYYLYTSKKIQPSYFSATFYKALILNLALLFICFLTANVFIRDPVKAEKILYAGDIRQMLREDSILLEKAENNFTDPQAHEDYIRHHFKIPSYFKTKGRIVLRDDYTLPNLYFDHLDFTDSFYVAMGRLGLGMYYYRVDSLQQAKQILGLIKNRKIPFVKYYLAQTSLELEDTSNALKYFQQSLLIKDPYYDVSFKQLIVLLEAQGRIDSLAKIISQPGARKYFSDNLALRIYFKEGYILSYYTVLLKKLFQNVSWLEVLAAFVIMTVWLLYIVRIDIFENEKAFPLLCTLLFGMVATALVFLISDFGEIILGFNHGDYWNKLFYYIIRVGLVEEIVKIIPLLFIYLFFRNWLNEAYDFVLYACVSSLGFSFIENLLYFQEDLTNIIYVRALTSVPAHMIGSSIVAYGFILSKYRYNNFPLVLSVPLFLLLGAIFHGFYDFWAFTHTISLFLFHLLLFVSLWIIIINNSINNSPHFSYRMKFKSENLQFFLSVALTAILALQYVILSLDQGPSTANQSLNTTLLVGGIFIVYYSDKLTNMDLVRGYWNTISYKSIADKRRSAPFNLRMFFIRLISGDIIAHTFVGNKISVQSDTDNLALMMLFHRTEKAEIIDRLVLTCILKKTNEEYKDPYWFQIKTAAPLIPGGYLYYFLRFADDRPSFSGKEYLTAYLFAPKHSVTQAGQVNHRNELRSLGRIWVKKLGEIENS